MLSRRQNTSDFVFVWSCLESRDVRTGDTNKNCLLEGGGVLKNLGRTSLPEMSFKPKGLKLKPKTEYKFQVTVKSKIGDPNDPRSR